MPTEIVITLFFATICAVLGTIMLYKPDKWDLAFSPEVPRPSDFKELPEKLEKTS